MENKFEVAYKQSEQANDLLKKIETMLAQSRRELAENLKKMDELTSQIPKTN